MSRLAVLGAGNMGGALVAGLLSAGTFKTSDVVVSDVLPEALRRIRARYGVRTSPDARSAARGAAIALLCVKPQQMEELLAEIRDEASPRLLIVSIAAGIRTDFIEARLPPGVPVVRVMPNTPALFGAGASVYCLGRRARPAHEAAARRVMASVGKVWKAKERDLDAVTALSGSGPAYAFLLAECMARAGRKLGLAPALSLELARRTVHGAGLMLEKSPEAPETLRQRVTSPGGTTEAALKILLKHMPGLFDRALRAATARSRELSRR